MVKNDQEIIKKIEEREILNIETDFEPSEWEKIFELSFKLKDDSITIKNVFEQIPNHPNFNVFNTFINISLIFNSIIFKFNIFKFRIHCKFFSRWMS